jgi:hypothetical protein
MTLKTNGNDPNNRGRQRLEIDLRSIWLSMWVWYAIGLLGYFLYLLPNLSLKSQTKSIATIKNTGFAIAIVKIIEPMIMMAGVADGCFLYLPIV